MGIGILVPAEREDLIALKIVFLTSKVVAKTKSRKPKGLFLSAFFMDKIFVRLSFLMQNRK